MRPRLFPTLVNGRTGDPALFVDFLHERRAMLFDIGEIERLPSRKILRLSDVFVSHAHVDHFIGFDRLLRILVGRAKTVRLYGPAGFVDRVAAKLAGYTWNLVESFADDLVFEVIEVSGDGGRRAARFRLRARFAREPLEAASGEDGVLLAEPSLRVRCAVLDHRTPCLGFAVEETAHVNVWRNRLDELGLPVGPWLHDLKAAAIEERSDDHPVEIGAGGRSLPFGFLRERVLSVTRGQKIGYVTDVAYSDANRKAVRELVAGADRLFIEAPFAAEEVEAAAARAHLTTGQAGALAREASVERVEPFHFSSRHTGEEDRMVREVLAAFRAGTPDGVPGEASASDGQPAREGKRFE